MPPRLRSKPYGPNSPNAAQALPDPAPRRRRATRSVSAQPQEDQPAPPVREPKARKTRGKATSRGKKKATRRISSPPPPEDPQPEELEGDETASGAVAQALSAKVESPTVENGASEEHHEPHGVNVDEPPVDQMQGVQAQEPRTPSQGPSADQSVAEQNRPDLETQERPATPSVEIPVTVLPSIEPSDPELTTPILGVLRSTGTASSRRHSHTRGSPSSSSEQSRVLRAQGATPIRRSRTPYANRSNSRRIESRGSLGRTLYRLPQLLSFGSQSELQDEVGEETNRADEHDSLNNPPETAAPDTTPPSTPERAPPATPVAPLTAPPAGTDVSPGWSRWIFNGVSRRWTVLRGRFAHDHDNRNESQQAIDTAAEPTVPTVPDSSAEAVSAANATTSQTTRAIVPDPSITSSASPAKTNRPDISPMHSGAQRKSPLNRPTPRFISHPRGSPEPRPRRRSTSFVDTRTLLAAGEPKSANDPYAHETQREFVKRRQAARAEHERQIREAKAREEEAARYAAAAAAEEARLKRYLPPPTPAKTLTSVSRARPVTSNTATRGPIFFLQPSQTMPITASIDPASRGTASKAPVAQTAAKSNADTENQNPRKRSRGFGLDEDDLAVHEEDFTPEEWQALKAQVEKAEEDAAKAAQESLPPSKKRRVDQSSKQKKRTQQSVRRQSTGTPRQTEPPNRTPGFVPNKRRTLAQPDLSPIDSSRLLTDPESPSNSQSPQAVMQPVSPNRIKSRRETTTSSRGSSKKAADEDPETGDETNDLQDASPLSRARNRAEQFKPKTPSRLRESARIPNSNASTPSALGFSSPSFLGVSINTTPLRSDAMSIDGSSFVANPDATPVGNQAFTTESDSTNTRREDVVPLQQPASSTAVAANTTESAVHIIAEDVAWLNETLPNGNFNELQWPPRRSLVGVLDIDPETVAIVEQNGQEKGPDLAKYFETMFEAHRAAPDEFVLAL